jgi:hypothetical protein
MVGPDFLGDQNRELPGYWAEGRAVSLHLPLGCRLIALLRHLRPRGVSIAFLTDAGPVAFFSLPVGGVWFAEGSHAYPRLPS